MDQQGLQPCKLQCSSRLFCQLCFDAQDSCLPDTDCCACATDCTDPRKKRAARISARRQQIENHHRSGQQQRRKSSDEVCAGCREGLVTNCVADVQFVDRKRQESIDPAEKKAAVDRQLSIEVVDDSAARMAAGQREKQHAAQNADKSSVDSKKPAAQSVCSLTVDAFDHRVCEQASVVADSGHSD